MAQIDNQGISNVNIREVLFILIFGAFGGALSWVYAVTIGQPLQTNLLLSLAASTVLGTGAAFVGVYVIANTDTRAFLRCLGFALLCGFSWKPVYDAGSALVNQQVKLSQAKEVTQKTTAAVAELSAIPPEQLIPKLREATALAETSVAAVNKVDDPTAAAEATQKTQLAVKELKQVSQEQKLPPDLHLRIEALSKSARALATR